LRDAGAGAELNGAEPVVDQPDGRDQLGAGQILNGREQPVQRRADPFAPGQPREGLLLGGEQETILLPPGILLQRHHVRSLRMRRQADSRGN
jgi:hypothetical protein